MATQAQFDEYCLFWINWWATCLTKSEWSSWVQALGTILALVVAGLLAWWEVHRRRIEEGVRVGDALMARVAILDVLLTQLTVFLRTLREHGDAAAPSRYGAYRGLVNILEEARKIELREMPTHASVLALTNARSVVALMSETFDHSGDGRWAMARRKRREEVGPREGRAH
jgi:hypothetical protein